MVTPGCSRLGTILRIGVISRWCASEPPMYRTPASSRARPFNGQMVSRSSVAKNRYGRARDPSHDKMPESTVNGQSPSDHLSAETSISA